MLKHEREQTQERRGRKAKLLRYFRNNVEGLSPHAIRELSRMKFGSPPRVQPEVLADYYPLYLEGEVIACHSGDAESWRVVFLCPVDWSDQDIENRLGVSEYYGGSGRVFSSYPWVERNQFHTIVHWSGGLDI